MEDKEKQENKENQEQLFEEAADLANRNKLPAGEVRKNWKGLCRIAVLFSVFTFLCLYRNVDGIAGTVWAVAAYVLFFAAFDLLGKPIKKESYFLAAGTILLAFSNACALNSFFHLVNWMGILTLITFFFLEQWQETGDWGIWEAIKKSVRLWCHGLVCVPEPCKEAGKKFFETKNRKKEIIFLITFCACIPALIIMALILGSADPVFFHFLKKVFLFPKWSGKIWNYVLWLLGGFFCFYCLFSAGEKESFRKEEEKKSLDSFPALVACSLFAVLYGAFCGIQIFYLFGRGAFTLPEGLTYAAYARSGFFELLFVAALNFCCFLWIIKRFEEERCLKYCLTFLILCTFIMIGSAAYRMLMYIRQFDLTLLRVLVLWFLAVLVVLFLGCLIYLYGRHFSFLRFCVVVFFLSWLLLVFSKPDAWIVEYNIRRGQEASVDFEYIGFLSKDAASVLGKVSEEEWEGEKYFWQEVESDYQSRSIREWNLSSWMGKREAEKWRKRYLER